MLVICFIIIGAANAFQTLSITQFKVGSIESGNNENYQTAFDNYKKIRIKKMPIPMPSYQTKNLKAT